MPLKRHAALIILDGWGYREEREANAVALANTPVFDRLWKDYPHTLINASEEWVGLPRGQMGNSEVGHLNIGAGRVVFQDIVRINHAIETTAFFRNRVLLEAFDRTRNTGQALHLMGLLSDGGVHSHQDHLYALLKLAKERGVGEVYLHVFLDGRDTAPTDGERYLRQLMAVIEKEGVGQIATVMGRYYAMDRDKRWERTETAYRAMVMGEGIKTTDVIKAVKASYEEGITDEFMKPIVVQRDGSLYRGIQTGDTVLCFNFRADRVRQITERLNKQLNLYYVCMTHYRDDFPYPEVFPAEYAQGVLGEVFGEHGVANLRLAETEKYAHVTFFFNGGNEKVFPGESRVLIPSPKVATYDLQPEMSAPEVADRFIQELSSGAHQAIICNFANPDMVGHTGKLEAAVKACETVDACLGRVMAALQELGWAAIVTADHGNCEVMVDPETGEPHTAHTTNPVPCIVVDPQWRGRLLAPREGALKDLAPTLLGLMGLSPSPLMSGKDLRLS